MREMRQMKSMKTMGTSTSRQAADAPRPAQKRNTLSTSVDGKGGRSGRTTRSARLTARADLTPKPTGAGQSSSTEGALPQGAKLEALVFGGQQQKAIQTNYHSLLQQHLKKGVPMADAIARARKQLLNNLAQANQGVPLDQIDGGLNFLQNPAAPSGPAPISAHRAAAQRNWAQSQAQLPLVRDINNSKAAIQNMNARRISEFDSRLDGRPGLGAFLNPKQYGVNRSYEQSISEDQGRLARLRGLQQASRLPTL